MPIYEYQCPKCGTFEVSQRITEKELSKCPTCKCKVKKLISNTSFQLKGSGWYVTDYARKGQNGEAKSSETSKSSDSKKSESKSESKKSESASTSGDKPASSASSSSSSTSA